MSTQKISLQICTLGPIGYFGASGTIATLFTLPLVFLMHNLFGNSWLYLGIISLLFIASIFLVNRALAYLHHKQDPSEIVIDELIGCLLTFWGIVLSTKSVLVGFLLFRALDIIKIGLVRYAETWPEAWGVIGDDIIAALLANAILRLLF